MNPTEQNNLSNSIQLIPLPSGLHALTISDFLSKEERDTLFDTVCNNQNAFHYLNTPDGNSGGTLHLATPQESTDNAAATRIRQACKSISTRIQNILPELFPKLGIEPFSVAEIPLSVMNGLDGHTGSIHTDESGGRHKISLLYYFHKTPKAFQGGALELFETDEKSPNGYKEQAFAKIEHQDNVLIAFPSETFHGVTDVTMDSTAFEDGRFVVVGFLG
jgi:Rps23 Pro-64 3,4-dihydroxylase Tpa1-like proline 4-hydroxylase